MGDLHWRKKGTRLGCRRGWWRLAAFVLFVMLAGYFGLYTWLRVSDEIRLTGHKEMGGIVHLYAGAWGEWWFDPSQPYMLVGTDEIWVAKWPRWSTTLMLMWPAVKLEAALDRRGWLPWTNVRPIPMLPPPPIPPSTLEPISSPAAPSLLAPPVPEFPSADDGSRFTF